jgi:hypothetical protein
MLRAISQYDFEKVDITKTALLCADFAANLIQLTDGIDLLFHLSIIVPNDLDEFEQNTKYLCKVSAVKVLPMIVVGLLFVRGIAKLVYSVRDIIVLCLSKKNRAWGDVSAWSDFNLAIDDYAWITNVAIWANPYIGFESLSEHIHELVLWDTFYFPWLFALPYLFISMCALCFFAGKYTLIYVFRPISL